MFYLAACEILKIGKVEYINVKYINIRISIVLHCGYKKVVHKNISNFTSSLSAKVMCNI